VVRTEPADGSGTPLNARIVIVFSEPIDGSTLTDKTIRLKRGFVEVAGQVQFVDAEQMTAEIVPAEPLEADTDYELEVTQGIEDLDGEALEAAVSVGFTTRSAIMLVFTVQPTDATAGEPVTPAVRSGAGRLRKRRAGPQGHITVALGQNPGGASLSGTTRRCCRGAAPSTTCGSAAAASVHAHGLGRRHGATSTPRVDATNPWCGAIAAVEQAATRMAGI
jgi:hypothetical protein